MPEWGYSQIQPMSSGISRPRGPEDTYFQASPMEKRLDSYPMNAAPFNLLSLIPPPIDFGAVAQRIDEVNTLQRILYNKYTSLLTLTGELGVGKSFLAALFYRRIQLAAQSGRPAPRHQIWLTIGPNTTIPDIITAILTSLDLGENALYMFPPDQQLSLLLQALRRPGENALIVLDQFEQLFEPEGSRSLPGRGATELFLDMMQQDLGESRFLLTCYSSPYATQLIENERVRSYLVTRINIPEGIALMQQLGVQGTPPELSLAWQRCAGHAYSLVLFSTLVHMTGMTLSYLLNSPDFRQLWTSEVTLNLVKTIYQQLPALQRSLLRALTLFTEPIPASGIVKILTGENYTSNNAMYESELQSLTNLSLVQKTQNDQGTPLYFLHSLLRSYIYMHYLEGDQTVKEVIAGGINFVGLAGAPDQPDDMLHAAHTSGHLKIASYYYQQAREQKLKRQGEEPRNSLEVHPIISAIEHLCLAQRWQDACDLLFAENLHERMVQWGDWPTLIRLYTAMLPPQGILSRRDEALVCSNLGLLYSRMSDYQQSQTYYVQSISLQQQQKQDPRTVAITLINQGELYRSTGDFERAEENFQQATKMNDRLHDPLIASVLFHNLGLIAQNRKNYQEAFRYYLSSLQIAHNRRDTYNEGIILTSIGMLFYEQGQPVESISVLLYALQFREKQQDPTVGSIQLLLSSFGQQMGRERFAQCYQAAQGMQAQLLTRLLGTDVRK